MVISLEHLFRTKLMNLVKRFLFIDFEDTNNWNLMDVFAGLRKSYILFSLLLILTWKEQGLCLCVCQSVCMYWGISLTTEPILFYFFCEEVLGRIITILRESTTSLPKKIIPSLLLKLRGVWGRISHLTLQVLLVNS